MYFLSALMPSGMILVLLAPNAPDEQIASLFQEQGFNTVHHVAIIVDDIYAAAEVWQNKGFIPLSMTPQEDGSLCQWFFRNWAGQIIELISRQWMGKETFSCENIAGLRLSELAA
ncbi:VOC family protein [Nostoc sp.]